MWSWLNRRSARSDDRSVLGPGISIRGDFESDGYLEIRGRVEGEIVHSGRLVIARGAVWKGNIRADELVIAGQVHGNVDVLEELELEAGGQLIGDVACARLVVAPGAIFEGRNRMGGPAAQSPALLPAPIAGAGPALLDRIMPPPRQSLLPDTPLAILAEPVRGGEKELLLEVPQAAREPAETITTPRAEPTADAPAFFGGFVGGQN
jgi:cytoskeletal protein CcmA (bactofilin family)